MQCKDIPDAPILQFLANLKRGACSFAGYDNSVQNAMPPLTTDPNDKLARAKMRMLIRRGLVDGCPCGCRGDFTLTDKGREYLSQWVG